MNKRILIIGGLSQARSIAESLINQKYKVTLINENYELCLLLSDTKGLKVIHGDGSKPYVLEDANVGECDIAIILTEHDSDNLVIAQLCQYFGVRKTVVLVNDSKKTDFFYKMGINSVVCATSAITSIIEQQTLMDELATVVPIAEGRVRITEVIVPNTSPLIGKKLANIKFPKQVIIGCILRQDISIVPSGETTIEVSDTLLLISATAGETEAIKMITGKDL